MHLTRCEMNEKDKKVDEKMNEKTIPIEPELKVEEVKTEESVPKMPDISEMIGVPVESELPDGAKILDDLFRSQARKRQGFFGHSSDEQFKAKPLYDSWLKYRKGVLPPDLPQDILDILQKTFYGGANSFRYLIHQSTRHGIDFMGRMWKRTGTELDDFAQQELQRLIDAAEPADKEKMIHQIISRLLDGSI